MLNDNENSFRAIVNYIIGIRGRGAFLCYADYDIIDSWLNCSKSEEHLLLVLDDILPAAFAKIPGNAPPPSLKRFDARVLKALR